MGLNSLTYAQAKSLVEATGALEAAALAFDTTAEAALGYRPSAATDVLANSRNVQNIVLVAMATVRGFEEAEARGAHEGKE